MSFKTIVQKESRMENRGRFCSEPGCDRIARTKGMCVMHYQRRYYKGERI